MIKLRAKKGGEDRKLEKYDQMKHARTGDALGW